MNCKEKKKKNTKPREMPRIMISFQSESVKYTDLVSLGNVNHHIDKLNLICAYLVGLQYSHMIKLLVGS